MKHPISKIAVLAVLVMIVAFDATAATRSEIKRMVVEEALNSRVPLSLALAVAKVESDFQERALSTAGARGVMQIMPATANSEFGIDEDELWDPRLNIQLGIDYLEQLYDQYGGKWSLALSHYNGGTLKGKGANATPHSYTRKYVSAVINWHRRYADQARVWRIAKRDDSSAWVPARTRIAKTPKPAPRRIVVRQIPPSSIVRWYPADRHAPRSVKPLDDFSGGIKRPFPTRGPLDDFSSRVTWRNS
jgi:hypothetical protein